MEEQGLVERAVAGDRAAFAEVYDLYREEIFNHIFYKVGDQERAEELTQQVFLQAWSAIETYELRGFSISAWLQRIADNLVIDYWRGQEGVLVGGRIEIVPIDLLEAHLESLEEEPFTALWRGVDRVRLLCLTSQLTEEQQEVILLKFFVELPTRQVADFLGKRPGAVRALQFRAIEAMRQCLEGLEEEESRPRVVEEMEQKLNRLEREVQVMERDEQIRERARKILESLVWGNLLEDLCTTIEKMAERAGVSKMVVRQRAEAGVFVLPEGKRGTPTLVPFGGYLKFLVGEELRKEGHEIEEIAAVFRRLPTDFFAALLPSPLAPVAAGEVTVLREALAPEIDLDGLRPRLQKKMAEALRVNREVFEQRWDVDQALEMAGDLADLRRARDRLNQIVTELEGLQILPDGFSEEHLDVVLGWITEIWAEGR